MGPRSHARHLRQGSARRTATVVALALCLLHLSGDAARALPAETPDDTWMVNGPVRAISIVDTTVWIAGKFTSLRSEARGGVTVAASGLAAIDSVTGLPVDGLQLPVFTDTSSPFVHDVSARAGVLFVGGNFDAVNGQPRRNLAAIDARTGEVLPFRGPDGLRTIQAVLAAPGGDVYVGGQQPLSYFDENGRDVRGFARVKPTTTPDSPNGASIRDLAFGPDGSVFTAGAFDWLNGETHHVVAKVDPVTGAVDDTWRLGGNVGVNAIGVDLYLDTPEDALYMAIGGSDYVARYRISDGGVTWKRDTSGAAQAVTLDGEGNLIVGGHFQWVASQVGQFCGKNTAPTDECAPRLRLAAYDQATGALDPWAPDITPLYLGIFAVVVDDGHVHLGGDFKAVEAVPQLFYARLSSA